MQFDIKALSLSNSVLSTNVMYNLVGTCGHTATSMAGQHLQKTCDLENEFSRRSHGTGPLQVAASGAFGLPAP